MNGEKCARVTRRTSGVLVGMALLAGGCASPGVVRASEGSCSDPGTCKVVVRVVNCRISMDPDDLHVFNGPQPIMWNIDSASTGARFTAEGVAFKTPNNEFTRLHVLPDGKSAMVIDANGRPGRYDYKVTIVDGTTACPPLDPGVINHG